MSIINEVRVQFRGNAIRTGFLYGIQLISITDVCAALGTDVTPSRFNAVFLDNTRSYWAPVGDMVAGLEEMLRGLEGMRDAFPEMVNNIIVFKDMLPAALNFPTPEFLEYARQSGSQSYAMYPAQIRRCIIEAMGLPVSGNSYTIEVPDHLQTSYSILWHISDVSLRRSMAACVPYKECYQVMKTEVLEVAKYL